MIQHGTPILVNIPSTFDQFQCPFAIRTNLILFQSSGQVANAKGETHIKGVIFFVSGIIVLETKRQANRFFYAVQFEDSFTSTRNQDEQY
jgi:hypothetical protein